MRLNWRETLNDTMEFLPRGKTIFVDVEIEERQLIQINDAQVNGRPEHQETLDLVYVTSEMNNSV